MTWRQGFWDDLLLINIKICDDVFTCRSYFYLLIIFGSGGGKLLQNNDLAQGRSFRDGKNLYGFCEIMRGEMTYKNKRLSS
jgi:hypothetical protein